MNILRKFAAAGITVMALSSAAMAEEGQIRDPGWYAEREAEGARLDFIDVYDPWEGFNRRSYQFNRQFDRFVFLPAVRSYRFIFPGFARTGINNFWNNIDEVQHTSSSLLQFKPAKAIRSVGRFVINSTIGLAGLFDVASRIGLDKVNEDFGQVLGTWGVGPGPYFVIPILGPSTLRDGIGLAADQAFALWVNVADVPESRRDEIGLALLYAIDTRNAVPLRYGDLKSPFEYEMVRFVVTKRRELLVDD